MVPEPLLSKNNGQNCMQKTVTNSSNSKLRSLMVKAEKKNFACKFMALRKLNMVACNRTKRRIRQKKTGTKSEV